MKSMSLLRNAIKKHLKLIEILTIPMLASLLPIIYQNKVNK
jgi:hypothetical protein